MDDRLQKIQLNNPIPLHFYSPEERLPADDRNKIVIIKSPCTGVIYYDVASYDGSGYWSNDDGGYFTRDVIAWASFSPEWVLGVDL